MDPKNIPAPLRFLALLPLKITQLVLATVFSITLLPLYWLGWLLWHRPPNAVYLAQVKRYLKNTWTTNPPPPGLKFYQRVWLTLSILQKWIMSPIVGTAWLLDEFLYSRKLNQIPLTDPLLVISGGRSGSTQITRYLEEDPDLAAPNILMSMFPYLWLWKVAPRTIGRLISKDKVRAQIEKMMPSELLERHESDPFKADTFDGSFLSFHLNHMALNLGPEVGISEFSFAEFNPQNRQMFENDFVFLVERLGQKTLFHHGIDSHRRYPRFLLKGHFLQAAPALARHFPEANFLTVVRDPLSRLQSGINYLRVNPADPVLGPVPWEWLTSILAETESRYCEVEMTWFKEIGIDNRCVIRFSGFVNDLQAAMTKVYTECCGKNSLPPHVPINHPPRERKNYKINQSLEELGVNQDAIKGRLAEYIKWIS